MAKMLSGLVGLLTYDEAGIAVELLSLAIRAVMLNEVKFQLLMFNEPFLASAFKMVANSLSYVMAYWNSEELELFWN